MEDINYSVYKITNLINGKSYIGSSQRVQARWQDHKNRAFRQNDSQYNYPLYRAFRKYGMENFSFEILKDNFTTKEEMEDYEREMIIYYNTLGNDGYNQTLETHCALRDKELLHKNLEKVSQPCAKVDIYNNIIEIYDSYQDASRKNGDKNNASHIREVCKGIRGSYKGEYYRDINKATGQIVELPFKNHKNKRHIIAIDINNPQNELFFDSISQAAQELKADRSSIEKSLAGSLRYTAIKGYIIREIDMYGNIQDISPSILGVLTEYNRTNPIINGERHNITEWCKIYGISTNTYYRRLKEGMSTVAALTTPKQRR